MNRFVLVLTALMFHGGINPVLAQQQPDFPIGVYTAGGNDVDYIQMRNDLNLTWILGQGGSTSFHHPIETNNGGLKVITLRDNLTNYATSQRLEIQAEASNTGSQPYFQRILTPQTGGITAGGRVASVGIDQPGYLVSDVWPNDQYHYDKLSYTATFVMKITKANPSTDQVALLSVVCVTPGQPEQVLGTPLVLTDASFTTSDQPQSFELPFALQGGCSPPSTSGMHLTGGAGSPQNCLTCKNIDVRVYWYGNRTAMLDMVYIEDDVAHQLFPRAGQTSGSVDNLLLQDAQDFTNTTTFSLVKRLYLKDEPYLNAFHSYNYVDSKLSSSLSLDPSNEGRGRGIAANYWSANYLQWFCQEAQPHEILSDYYVLTPNIPSPSMTSALSVFKVFRTIRDSN